MELVSISFLKKISFDFYMIYIHYFYHTYNPSYETLKSYIRTLQSTHIYIYMINSNIKVESKSK